MDTRIAIEPPDTLPAVASFGREPMTLFELLGLMRKHVRLLVILPIACAIAAGAYCYTMMRDVYSASTTLYVLVSEDAVDAESYSSLYSNFNVSQQIANDVSQLITSNRVRSDAIRKLGWNSLGTYDIGVSSAEESRVLRIIVSGYDSEGVAKVANALAEVTSEVAQDVMNVQSVNVLDRAIEPALPSGPNRKLYILVAALGGFSLAFVGILLSSVLDTRIHDGKTAESVAGITGLGRVPKIEEGKGRSGDSLSPEVLCAQDSVKTLLANLMFLGVDDPVRTVVVTSSTENEGKSTVACLLVQAIAMSGQSVLLVDCDLRHRSLEDILGVRADRGIGAALHGTPIEQVVRSTNQENLFFLNAEPDIPNPTEIISSKRFKTLLGLLADRYRFVVLDAPPLGTFADASVLASLADATLLVVREGYTRKASLSMAAEQLRKAGASVAGLALNCSETVSSDLRYGHAYGRRRPVSSSGESVASLAFKKVPGHGAHTAQK